MKNTIIKVGYILALLCFLSSLFIRKSNSTDLSGSLMAIGGILLTFTSIYKITTEKNDNKK